MVNPIKKEPSMKYIIAILLLISASLSNAGTIDQKNQDYKYVEYGAEHKCVVEIGGIYHKDTKFRASAVVFKPSWILTAAHIIQNAKHCFIKNGDEIIQVTDLSYPEEYDENKFGFYDIAIGKLEKEVNLNFYPELYTKDDENNKICSISGFGLTGPFQISATRTSDNKKRAGTNTVNRIENHLLICNLIDKNTALEFLICHGDSGGGLFIDKKLAGINSCIFSDDKKLDSDIKDESGHTRVSFFTDWINKSIDKIEQNSKKTQ